jgi:membrane protein
LLKEEGLSIRADLPNRLIKHLKTVFFRLASVWSSFNSNQGHLRAAALTYSSMLALVPLLAIAFALLKGMGAQNALEPMLLQLAGDSSEETVSRIIGYVNNTNVKSLGAVGILMLVMTVISLLGYVEEAFNNILGVRESRPFSRRFSDFLSVVVVGPILLLVATSLTSTMQSQSFVQWLINYTYFGRPILMAFRLLPYLSIWVAMTFLYIYIPSVRIRLSSALLGGVVAGTIWQAAQWGYFHFQVGVANYNAIYGTLAALPIFLVWLFTSWIIVLLGFELVKAHQFGWSVIRAKDKELSVAASEELHLAVLLAVVRHYRETGGALSSEKLAQQACLPLGLVKEALTGLEDAQLVITAANSEQGWLPYRDPSSSDLAEVFERLRGKSLLDGGSGNQLLASAVRISSQAGAGIAGAVGRKTLEEVASETGRKE